MTSSTRFAAAYTPGAAPSSLGKRRLARLSMHDIAKKHGLHYSGDVNGMGHGGVFYKLPEGTDDYACAVRIVNMDDACGEAVGNGDILIEELTVQCPDASVLKDNTSMDGETLRSALDCSGFPKGEEINQHVIIEAMMSYGAYDIDNTVNVKGWTENRALNLIVDMLTD